MLEMVPITSLYCTTEIKRFSFFPVTPRDHMIKSTCGLLSGSSSSEAPTLSKFVFIGVVEVEMKRSNLSHEVMQPHGQGSHDFPLTQSVTVPSLMLIE